MEQVAELYDNRRCARPSFRSPAPSRKPEPIRYLSVCSGIEAATVAWHELGWMPAGFSEIEAFPSAVLAHHYPEVPNLGDMTKHEDWNLGTVDLLVGGTPCQSFSVAGLRKGLADPRGNLMLTYLAIAERRRPRWIVWENVPGVLSSNRGRDFGTFLGALGELGYGFAYRVLDAQWFGVAQRRRRVFVVGYLGDWKRAAAVLFESESVRRDTPPSREKGQAIARGSEDRLGGGGIPEVAETLIATDHKGPGHNRDHNFIAHTLRGEGFDAGEDGTGRGTPLVPVAFSAKDHGADAAYDLSPTLRAMPHNESHANGGGQMAVAQPIPYDFFQITAPVNRQSRSPGDPCHTLARDNAAHATILQPVATGFYPTAGQDFPCLTECSPSVKVGSGGSSGNPPGVQHAMQVRRLTPVECERLQGFPDNYTNIPWRKKPEAPDGPRYKALGNSMAVPVMRWIGERIDAVDATTFQFGKIENE